MTISIDAPYAPKTVAHRLVEDIRNGSAASFWSAVIMLGLALVFFSLQHIDARLINGVSIWQKPTKFGVSFAIHLMTVSWALSLLPQAMRATRSIRLPVAAMIICTWAELIYFTFRASRAQPSHFNTTDIVAIAGFAGMAVAAVILTGVAGYIGLRLWPLRRKSLMIEAASVALFISSIFGIFTGLYTGFNMGHSIGGDVTDATGLPIFNWSTTGGDLRVSHFVGLHIAQAVPLVALLGNRGLVYAAAIGMSGLTVFTFGQAVLGIPLISL
jgi:hypothetical protein